MNSGERDLVAARTNRGTEVAILACGLTKRFKSAEGDVRALNGVDVEVQRGQMLVLLGPSGCGKTTLLRCIGGLESPDDGEIWLDGRMVTSLAQRINVLPENRNLGMMFQTYGLWPHMTVRRNVAYPLENQSNVSRKEIRTRVSAMLETMGLNALGERYPGQLSGGQQQRVALARALVASPTALLFDEPLSNVDAQVRKRLREEIRQMKDERGFAGVYVTHDQEEAMALADILAVMQDGEVRQIGSPWDIYRRPRSLYVARFIGEANTLPACVAATDAGNAMFETEIGPLLINQVDPAPAIGTQGHVVVRPEDIVILDSLATYERGEPNLCAGTIMASILLGPHVELKVRVGQSELRVHASSALTGNYDRGNSVNLKLSSERLVWIPA
jgi:iron(III) transport system ATP-binding protein